MPWRGVDLPYLYKWLKSARDKRPGAGGCKLQSSGLPHQYNELGLPRSADYQTSDDKRGHQLEQQIHY